MNSSSESECASKVSGVVRSSRELAAVIRARFTADDDGGDRVRLAGMEAESRAVGVDERKGNACPMRSVVVGVECKLSSSEEAD